MGAVSSSCRAMLRNQLRPAPESRDFPVRASTEISEVGFFAEPNSGNGYRGADLAEEILAVLDEQRGAARIGEKTRGPEAGAHRSGPHIAGFETRSGCAGRG